MPNDDLTRALHAVGVEIDGDPLQLAGGASGSGVYRIRVDGNDAVVKVTTARHGKSNARRELAFYRTLADQLPVATPTLLRYADTDDFTALVLSAHGRAVPAADWCRSSWLTLTRQLAALHSIPPPGEGPWIDPPWHRQDAYLPPLDLAENYWSTTSAAVRVRPLIDAPDVLAHALRAIPDRFVHGDCHVENLLREPGRIVWTDWQVAGVGSPAGDLAFLWSRAGVDGAQVPYDAMLDEYLAHRPVDPALLRRALMAAEIHLLLFAWPHHARSCTPDQRDHLTGRLLHLFDDWNAAAL
jgi:Ser/Thr protein kinase RdoA (MazF antagonist)